MGHYTDMHGRRCFTPENTDTTLYIPAIDSPTLGDLLERAAAHFGADASLDRIEISAEHIHTECLGHDCYDPSDWTDFIVLTLIPSD